LPVLAGAPVEVVPPENPPAVTCAVLAAVGVLVTLDVTEAADADGKLVNEVSVVAGRDTLRVSQVVKKFATTDCPSWRLAAWLSGPADCTVHSRHLTRSRSAVEVQTQLFGWPAQFAIMSLRPMQVELHAAGY